MTAGVGVGSSPRGKRGLRLAAPSPGWDAGFFFAPQHRRLANHVLRHAMQWFWFLIDPKID
ncbi:MAG: hypothetical protein K6T86_13920, partial [Pirellulales bacterium]|nr:hypothetical protein [Pirellulales bacterium]